MRTHSCVSEREALMGLEEWWGFELEDRDRTNRKVRVFTECREMEVSPGNEGWYILATKFIIPFDFAH